jgi:hypothetical protein
MTARRICRRLAPESAANLLGQVSGIGGGEEPTNVLGCFQGGHLRRVRADYPNGWRLQFSISPRGIISRVKGSLHLHITGGQS